MSLMELDGKIAVVTGAASGIGRALAEALLAEGMAVCLADVERGALERAQTELRSRARPGRRVIAQETDVSNAEQVEDLADRVGRELGDPHLLCSNAGVANPGGAPDEVPASDWEWIFGVNFYGAVHCLRSFLPRMRKLGAPAHILFTASSAGILATANGPVYAASKHAVVGLAESLHHQLKKTQIGVSLLCPEFVATRILEAERNRPAALAGRPADPETAAAIERYKGYIAQAMSPSEVARQSVEAIKAGRFWILTHARTRDAVRARAEAMIMSTLPPDPIH